MYHSYFLLESYSRFCPSSHANYCTCFEVRFLVFSRDVHTVADVNDKFTLISPIAAAGTLQPASPSETQRLRRNAQTGSYSLSVRAVDLFLHKSSVPHRLPLLPEGDVVMVGWRRVDSGTYGTIRRMVIEHNGVEKVCVSSYLWKKCGRRNGVVKRIPTNC